MPQASLRVFCDFDGTIVRQDVGDAFFETFSGREMWDDNALFQAGKISARETFARHFSRISALDDAAMDRFCLGFSVDPGFSRFLDMMDAAHIPVTILSDGLDIYISRILGPLSERVEVFTNHVDLRSSRPSVHSMWSGCGMRPLRFLQAQYHADACRGR